MKVFLGQRYDVQTDFLYNYFRDYDPTTGRYLQSDPIGLTGGDNTYTYVYGNPATNFDIYGLFAESCTCDSKPKDVLYGRSVTLNETQAIGLNAWLSKVQGHKNNISSAFVGLATAYLSMGTSVALELSIPTVMGLGSATLLNEYNTAPTVFSGYKVVRLTIGHYNNGRLSSHFSVTTKILDRDGNTIYQQQSGTNCE